MTKEASPAAESLQKQQARTRGRPFEKGRSGNPAGRAPGSRNRATQIAEHLLDAEAEGLTRRVIAQAFEGDARAQRLCFDRLLAPRRERPVELALPPVEDPDDLVGTMAAIASAALAGEITPGEAAGLAQVMETWVHAIETRDFDRRLVELEKAHAAPS